MFGIGLPEFILLVIIALLVFDPQKLPEVARSLGKIMMTFREATREVRTSLDEEVRRVKTEVEKDLNKEEENGRSEGPPPKTDFPGDSEGDRATEKP
jgi:Tat protein translocase TatB subunit